jgi:hypothetical protein
MLHGIACLVTAVSLMVGSPSLSSAPGAEFPLPASRIVGRVIDGKTRAGIGAVRVRLDDGRAETTTAPDGAFEFADVSVGRHAIVAILEGFAPSAPVQIVVDTDADARVEIEYSLGVMTEVRGTTPASPAVPSPPSLGLAELSGLQIASAVGGLDDLLRVMQQRPGVAASQDNRNDVMVRGGGAMETAVRLDGFELPTASHFAWPGGAGGGLNLIPSTVVDRAAVESSGFSVAFGERASALLDIDMKKGETSRARGLAEIGAGGVLGLAEGRLPGGSGQAGSYLVSARRSLLEVAFSEGDSRATPSYVEVMGNVDVPLSQRHRLHVLGLRSSDGLDVSWSESGQKDLDGDQDLALVGVSLKSAWTPKTETLVSAAWSSAEMTLSDVEQSVNSFTNHSIEHYLRARAEVRRTVTPAVRLLAGVAVKRSDFDYALQDGAYRNEWGILVPAVRSSWSDAWTGVAGYAETVLLLGPVRIDAGIRADREGTTSEWYASPRARVEYRPGSHWRLMGTVGQYRQDIPAIWIGSNTENRMLDPVRCLGWTAGVEGAPWRGVQFSVEGFSKRYEGYPIDPSVPSRVLISAGADFESPLVGKLVPSGLVHADGVDTSLSQGIGRSLTIAAGYSYWDVSEYNLEKKWIRADYDIRHQGRVWAVWHGGKRWTASVLWRYASGRPYTPYDVAASIKAKTGRLDRTKTNAVTYDNYHRLDVRAERLFVKGRTAVTAFAEVINLYNRDNILVYDWSNTAKAPLPIYQWGITPVAGVRVQF